MPTCRCSAPALLLAGPAVCTFQLPVQTAVYAPAGWVQANTLGNFEPPPVSREDLATYCFTSGTTGQVGRLRRDRLNNVAVPAGCCTAGPSCSGQACVHALRCEVLVEPEGGRIG